FTVGMPAVITSATRASGPRSRKARIRSPRASTPIGLFAPSTTGNSLWLVRNSVSTAASTCSSRASAANCVRTGDDTSTTRHSPRHRQGCHQMRFRGGGEINEDGDEDQKRIAEQAEKAEHEGYALSDHGRNLGGAHVAEAGRQQCAQHAAAVHRKGRDQIEQ